MDFVGADVDAWIDIHLDDGRSVPAVVADEGAAKRSGLGQVGTALAAQVKFFFTRVNWGERHEQSLV